MSTIKVDTIATRTGSGNITVSNTIAGTSATLSGTLGVTGAVATGTLTVVDDVSIQGATPTLALADTDVSNNKVELNYDEFLTIDIDPNNARGNTGLIIKGDNSERLRLDSSGRMMIGTTTEGHASADELTVAGTGNSGITIRSGTSNSGAIYFSDATSGAAEYAGYINYSHGIDSMTLGVSGVTSLQIYSTGAVTKALQPAFQARLSGDQSNIAVNSNVTIQYGNETFDVNADYNNSNYTFTAPVTGKYQLNVQVLVKILDSAAAYYQIQLHTSNTIYYHTVDPDYGQDNTYNNQDISVLADMDAGDTALVKILQSGGSQQTDLDAVSTFGGILVA